MIGYTLRRLGVAVVLLWILSVITFAIYLKVPADPAGFLVDMQHASPQQIAKAHHLLGTDRPAIVQYGKYVDRLLHGDFGTSWATISFFGGSTSGSPVGPMVWRAALVTGSLLLGGFVLMLLVAVPLGTFAATRPRSFVDRLSLGLGVAAISTHPLVVGLLLQLFVGNRWKLLPASGYCTVTKPSPQLVAEAARTAPTGTPLTVWRRRAVGVASASAVVDVRTVLRRALHAHRSGADARGARRAVGEDCARKGRV